MFKFNSWCVLHVWNIIRKTVFTCSFYGMFFVHLCNQSSRWKDVHFVGLCYIIESQCTVQRNIRFRVVYTSIPPIRLHDVIFYLYLTIYSCGPGQLRRYSD